MHAQNMGAGKEKVFIAMSGGVDSSVAAALLKERGFNVRGVHIKMWSDPNIPCAFKEDRYDAMRVAAKLDIPFETWDFTKEYRRAVVEYMIREYAAGRTPNPDVMCNRHIKFGVFLGRALAAGADYIATGHYTRKLVVGSEVVSSKLTSPKLQTTRYKLLTAHDKNKDQSYFLWTLTQDQLKRCLFPIGEHIKPEVRRMARKFGLPTAEKEESQGICFIGELDLPEFLKKYIPAKQGVVLTTSGKVIGEHEGLSFYTVGQRHGIGVGGGIPYYVAEKNFEKNALVVAEGPYDEKLFSRELNATAINWIAGKEPKLPLRCQARIRYRQPLQDCRITRIDTNSNTNLRESIRENSRVNLQRIRVVFEESQRAVTPGQSIVLYQGEKVLGGGIIA